MNPDSHNPATHTRPPTPQRVADNPRQRVDWKGEALHFFLALDPPRSSQVVAARYSVTRARVNVVRKRDNWDALAADVDRRALESATSRIVLSRQARVTKTLGIVDGFLARFDEKLDELELRPADLPGIVKLAELLVGEATDRMGFAEVQQALSVTIQVLLPFVPKPRRAEALRAVREQVGAIEAAA